MEVISHAYYSMPNEQALHASTNQNGKLFSATVCVKGVSIWTLHCKSIGGTTF